MMNDHLFNLLPPSHVPTHDLLNSTHLLEWAKTSQPQKLPTPDFFTHTLGI